MNRDPSLHIPYSRLKIILRSLGMENSETIAKRIMQAAVPHNIKDRYIVTGDSETQKKARRLISASTGVEITTERFNRLLTTVRTQQGHRGVTHYKLNDSNWLLLKEIAQLAGEFSKDFSLDVEEGAKIFILLGLRLMKRSYGLGKFKYYSEKIRSLYIAADMVENDPEPDETRKVYQVWQRMMKHYGNFSYELKTHDQYVNMVYVRMEAAAVEASYFDWLKAQFEFFTLFQNVPTLTQLVTDLALQRYYDYMGKKNSGKQVIKNDNTDYKSEFDRQYFEAVRAKLGET